MYVRSRKDAIHTIALFDSNNLKHTFFVKADDLVGVVTAFKEIGLLTDVSTMNFEDYVNDSGLVEKTNYLILDKKHVTVPQVTFENYCSNITVADVLWIADQKINSYKKIYKPVFKGIGKYSEKYSNEARTCYTQKVLEAHSPIFIDIQNAFTTEKASIITNIKMSNTVIESLVYFEEKSFDNIKDLRKDMDNCTGKCLDFNWSICATAMLSKYNA